MRRTDRLFDIIQVFRDGKLHKGEELAERMTVSLRTIYRDIDTLVASGIPITGERGVGYLMTDPVFLPPLNITQGELEVLELGLALVRASFGRMISMDAQILGDKVRAVLPRPEMLDANRGSLGVYHVRFSDAERQALEIVRRGILSRTMLRFDYLSLRQMRSHRTVRPLEVQVWEAVLTLTAWCEDREDFRVFRLDRMKNIGLAETGFRLERGKMLQDYKKGSKQMATEPTPDNIIEDLLARFEGTHVVEAWGERSVFYNPGRRLPRGVYFVTVKERDGNHDKASQLYRAGAFRLNVGTTKPLFLERFGPPPTRPGRGGVVDGPWDFTASDALTPHPVYGWMSWIAVLNPSSTTLVDMEEMIGAAFIKAKYAFDNKIK